MIAKRQAIIICLPFIVICFIMNKIGYIFREKKKQCINIQEDG